jgi:outer membrane murein-binding lipoprotein Lpp
MNSKVQHKLLLPILVTCLLLMAGCQSKQFSQSSANVTPLNG